MYLKQTRSKKTGRTHLSMVHSYRDKERGHSRTKTVETFGYVDELEKIHDDPISYYQKIVEARNIANTLEIAEYSIIAKKNEEIEKNVNNRKNYGYGIIMKIFYELGLDHFLINKQQRDTKTEYDTCAIMKLLVISRILSPGSKKGAFEEKGRYFDFEKNDRFNLLDIYRSLTYFAKFEKDIQDLMHERITKKHGRNLDLVYYDVTNYYFEIDLEDELRKKGYSKEHRKSPIVQLGLAMDVYDILKTSQNPKKF